MGNPWCIRAIGVPLYPPVRIQREVRQILNSDDSINTQLGLVLETLQAAGIEPATPPPDLSAIEEHDIRLVAWMAVGVEQIDPMATREGDD